ncbi:MAG: RHS repeat-associated core domain-containing protein [Bacteroidia bacterium]
MEGDGEIAGQGNSNTTYYRQYDSRIGRWLSLDPEMSQFPNQSPYNFVFNNPITSTDPLGNCPDGDCETVSTPRGGELSIPSGSSWMTDVNGNVHAFQSQNMDFVWNSGSGQYESIGEGHIYSSGEAVDMRAQSRFEKSLDHRIRVLRETYPNAHNASNYVRDGDGNVFINLGTDESGMGPFETMNPADYPEVGVGESFVPIWGSGKQAYYDFQDGRYGWATFNTTMAVSDVFLVKSIVKGVAQGGFRAMMKGNQPWNSRMWWDPNTNYSRFYHTSGFAGPGEPIHHAFLYQSQGIAPNWLKHQMWNLKPIRGRAINGVFYDGATIHRAIHGNSRILQLNRMQRLYYGTPSYIGPLGISVGLRGMQSGTR